MVVSGDIRAKREIGKENQNEGFFSHWGVGEKIRDIVGN